MSELAPEAVDEFTDVRPELRPIAKRHGRELFMFALHLGNANAALSHLAKLAHDRNNAPLRPIVDTIGAGMAGICNIVVAAKGWKPEAVTECRQDIARVRAIVRAAQPPRAPGNKIILPS